MNASDELRAALAGAAEDFDTLRGILSQIGAVLFHAKDDGPRAADLIELAQYIADDWADAADTMRQRASIAASATNSPSIPTAVTVHRTHARRATARVGGNSASVEDRQ